MKLDYDKILDAANSIYASGQLKALGHDSESLRYLAPEQIPKIQSDVAKAILEALVEEINANVQFKPTRLGPG